MRCDESEELDMEKLWRAQGRGGVDVVEEHVALAELHLLHGRHEPRDARGAQPREHLGPPQPSDGLKAGEKCITSRVLGSS